MKQQLFSINQINSTKTEENISLCYRAEIITTSTIFQGHFPENPVVPGVCTLDMVKQCCADAIGERLQYSQIKECKYLIAILPTHEALIVEINLKKDQEGFQLVAEVLCEAQKMMKLKATLISK